MTFSFLWFVVGLAIGFNITMAYAWLSLRRANRKASSYLNAYQKINPNLIVFNHTKKRWPW